MMIIILVILLLLLIIIIMMMTMIIIIWIFFNFDQLASKTTSICFIKACIYAYLSIILCLIYIKPWKKFRD